MPEQRKTAPRSADRHDANPVGLRLGPDRIRVEEAARRAGVSVHRWLVDTVREKLDREDDDAASAAPGR